MALFIALAFIVSGFVFGGFCGGALAIIVCCMVCR